MEDRNPVMISYYYNEAMKCWEWSLQVGNYPTREAAISAALHVQSILEKEFDVRRQMSS